MFLAYQPHLHERQKRLEREAAKSSFSSPSTSSFTSTLKTPERGATIPSNSSDASSSKRGSEDGSTRYSKDDTSILTPSSSSSSVFGKKRFQRPKSSSGRTSSKAPTSPAHPFEDNNGDGVQNSPMNRSFQEKSTLSAFDVPLRGRPREQQETAVQGSDFSPMYAKGQEPYPSVSLYSAIPPRTTFTDSTSSPTSERKLGGNSMYQETGDLNRPAALLDGLGISHSHTSPALEDVTTELESVDLSHYPLPIRLGLIHPSQLTRSVKKRLLRTDRPYPTFSDVEILKRGQPTQYNHGYYLFTPPPPIKIDTKGKVASTDVAPNRPDRMELSSRRQVSGKRRSSSETRHGDLMSRPSIRSGHSYDHSQHRWKLEHYFKTYKKKDAFKTREYKFHAYPMKDASYWWGYSIKTLVSESLMHDIITATAGLTVLDWRTNGPPSRVLDIGTGTGKWVVDSAREWKESEFIGMDLVPVQTPLYPLQEKDLQRRVSWVVANALHGLPFPDHSFDFVHIRLINSGIPEDMWAALLSEVIRVLTRDGHVEIMESDWTFLGSPREMLTTDLQDLLLGQSRMNQEKLKMWKRRNDKRYDDLGAAVDRMLTRRLIKPDPASMIPFHLMNLEVKKIGQGKPRHFPVLARSSTHRAKGSKEEKKSKKACVNHAKPWVPEVNESSFTLRPQIGQPLPPHQFHVSNLDSLRMALLVSDVTRISEARMVIWEECEKDPINPCIWENFSQFDRQMDQWYKDMIDRADLENLLKSTFDWNEAASRMDSRIHNDREIRKRRKEIPNSTITNELSELTASPTLSSSSSSPSSSPREIDWNATTSRRHSYVTEDENEDQDTVRDETPTPNSFQQTTAILGFRTVTVFTAQKPSLA